MSQPEIEIKLLTMDQVRFLVQELKKELQPAPVTDLEQRLTIDEAAALCRVSKTTIREWVKKGLIPDHGPGKIRYFFKSELVPLLKAKRNGK